MINGGDLELRPARLESESRRHLTILFTDLSDSTRLSAVMEAETYAELLDDVRQAFKTVVEARRGTINQFQGDGLQAMFGYPHATEHDGLHATEAALEVHDRVRDLLRARYAPHGAPDLSVHSGIHAGVMLAREGDQVAGRFELFGPAPGIAKHLSDIAERDEILVSEETLGPGSHFFHTSERRLVLLKGREEPLAIHRILARTLLRTRYEAHAQRGLVPFIGRQAELQWLDQVLEGVIGGHARFVAVSAPPGVGKTRFTEEFLRRAAESKCSISRGYCEGQLSAEPLQPFLQMLRSRFGLAPGTAASAAAQLLDDGLAAIDPRLLVHRLELLQALSIQADEPPGENPRYGPPETTLRALRNLFAALARIQPQVVFIDDWHWADDATRQVVFAIQELTDLPILLLAATRPLELGEAQLTAADVLELGPLSDAEAQATISELLPSADPFVADQIRRYSGGNPLFIEELCHSAAGAGPRLGLDPVRGGSAWLETLIESRVARLPAEQAAILSAAAVIGNVVPAWLLKSLTECDANHPLVRGLAEHDLLFPGGDSSTLRFKHGITRDVVYGAVGLQRRRAMHRAIARLIRARVEPGGETEAFEALAYHHAGAAEFGEAARYAEMSGDKAMATSSIDRAKAQYRAAVDMLDRLPNSPQRYQAWRSIVRRLGLASVFDPARGDVGVFGQAVAQARAQEDPAGLAYAEYWLANISYALGESRAAIEHCELALQASKSLNDERLVAQVRATLGQAMAASGEYAGALELLDDTGLMNTDRRRTARAGPAIAYSLACKASVLGDLGRFDEAHACFEQALASLPAAGHEVEGSVLCWRSAVSLWQGRWEAARDDALAAQRVAERVKSLYLFAMSRGLGGYARWHLEPDAAALRDMADAASWLEAGDKNLFVSLNQGWLADAMASEGQVTEARGHAARALRRALAHDRLGAAMACRAMARTAAASHDWQAADRHLRLAARIAAKRRSGHEEACNDLCRAQVALLKGSRPEALQSLERAAHGFDRLQMRWHLEQATSLQRAS